MKVIEVSTENSELINKIYQNEIETFGENGAADMWTLKSLIRYGKVYVLINEELEILSVSQFQGIVNTQDVFLFGFSTPLNNRNKGYGKYLLEEVHKKLKKLDIKKIYLTVDPKNKIAINMYEKLGYKIKEFQKNEYGHGVDRYLMYKTL